jgi:hypothetical protein
LTVFNSEWLDIATGVVVVWFLFALAVSAINEGLVTVLGLRSKQLWSALSQMLDGSDPLQGYLRNIVGLATEHRPSRPAPSSAPPLAAPPLAAAPLAPVSTQLYETATVQALEIGKPTQKTRIDQIPATVFSHALLELAVAAPGAVAAAASDITQVTSYIDGLPSGPLKSQLLVILASAGSDIAAFRDGVERWFTGQMARLSRLYRAQVQVVLVLIGVVVAVVGFGFGLQSNSLQLVSELQHDQDLRTVVVGAANTAARGDLAKAGHCDPLTDTDPATCQLRGLSAIDEIDFALRGNAPGPTAGFGERLGFILPWRHFDAFFGVVLTAVAISFGSSFWFAALKRLTGLRPGATASSG